MAAPIVVIAQDGDTETDLVVEDLTARAARIVRFDLAEFPSRLRFTAAPGERWSGTLTCADNSVLWESVAAAYYRRPARCVFPGDMTGPERRFAMAEAIGGLGGLISSLPGRFVNHPGRAADAEYKPLQLQTAYLCGFRVPPTIVTNEVEAVRRFSAETVGPMVYKPLAPAVISEEGRVKTIYTSLVDPDDLDERQIGLTAHLFQEFIADKVYDVRVTVVGRRVFPVAVHAGSPAERVDWRSAGYENLRYEVIDIPGDVRDSVVDYLRRLDLEMAAFDFSVDRRGRWWFLEANPQGLWGFVQEATGAPISRAIADLLVEGQQ